MLHYSKALFALFILLAFTTANAQQQGFNSISTADGVNIIAVGDNGNFFRSTTAGQSWAKLDLFSTANMKSVTTFGDNVWIAAENGIVYKTNKVSISPATYSVGSSNSIKGIYFVDDNLGFVCGASGTVYKTTNGGQSWTSSSTGIAGTDVLNSVSFRDANNGVVVGNNGVTYITVNGGLLWTIQPSGVTKNLSKVKYFSDGVIYAVGEYGTMLSKTTIVSPWVKINTRISEKNGTDIRGISGSSSTDVHVVGGGGFIRNNKSGSSEFLNFEMNPMMANLVDICYFDANTGWAVSSLNNAIIKTTNGGTSWNLTGGTTLALQWDMKLSGSNGIGNNLCKHPTLRDVMFVMYGNKIYRSANRGDNWTQIATASTGNRAHSFYVSPRDTNIWMAAVEDSPDKVIRTTNYGATWTTILSANFSNYGQPLEMDQNNPSTFYFAPDNGGFWKSTNDGATFTEISNNYPFRSPCDLLVKYDSSNVVFLADGITGSGFGEIFRSSNGGVNWTKVHTNQASGSGSEVPSMCTTPFDVNKIYATEWSGSNVYKTSNGGLNWTLSHSNGFSGWASDICHEDPTLILTGNYGPNSALSTDNGVTWTRNTSGLSGSGAGMIVPERGYQLNMMTGNLYKMRITYTVLTDVEENTITGIPTSYSLHQNYPNPFNPSTSIRYDLKTSGMVKLSVFDMIGRQVAVLQNGVKSAGSYEVKFDASGLTSGIYFYKIETPNFSDTKKMILIK